jgi:hypothetical protein
MQILIDYNLEGDADLLIATLQQDGWTDLLLLEFVHLRDTPLGRRPKTMTSGTMCKRRA